jgi:hypothetical protein
MSDDEFDPSALRGPDHQVHRLTAHEPTPGEIERALQDFTAGSVFAHGAGALVPQAPTSPAPAAAAELEPVFAVFVHEDERTFGPAPQLAALFARLNADPDALREQLEVDAVWSIFQSPDGTLLKLRVAVQAPAECAGRFELVLIAEHYAAQWQHIVDGGALAITSLSRFNAAAARPGATFSDGLNACLVMITGHSPAVELAIQAHGWPRRPGR